MWPPRNVYEMLKEEEQMECSRYMVLTIVKTSVNTQWNSNNVMRAKLQRNWKVVGGGRQGHTVEGHRKARSHEARCAWAEGQGQLGSGCLHVTSCLQSPCPTLVPSRNWAAKGHRFQGQQAATAAARKGWACLSPPLVHPTQPPRQRHIHGGKVIST